ncbi:hypothetical protein A943_19195 [Bacillus sp. CPSM8]|nr:hypothetical protein SC10_B2orf03507 [Bacillus paralicheniformis]ETB69642.1 hypothetical protein A943_19195 [Bacillus sp. CPSM8]KUL14877.1 hypothetical protein LI7559_00125 [Bacillus licheniformis LMG 7559]OLG07705.1 hypothetical protein B4125_1886 [Bacillus paralicheniformis]
MDGLWLKAPFYILKQKMQFTICIGLIYIFLIVFLPFYKFLIKNTD